MPGIAGGFVITLPLPRLCTKPLQVPVRRSRIGKATPAGNLAVSHCEHVHPVAMVLLLRITHEAFQVAKHRDVLASLDKFSRLEHSQIIETIEIAKKGGHLRWISSQAGMGPTRWADEFPINFVGDQLQQCRNVPATKSFVSLFCDVERCAHVYFGGWK